MNQIRLHIKLGDQRTTISVDAVLAVMLAIKLGHDPDDAAQAARELMVEAIADKKLSRAYDDWVIG
ncbi:MAG TPA: hypothetical protein VK972_10015 [Wenzhouxiangella sp.]|nr:hypothetical protein [Wenzhouxiangella sp.]